jgi:SulP family sulfate permease
MAQMPEIIGVGWHTYPVILGGLAVIYLFPRLTRAIPSPLVAIVVLSIVAIVLRLDVRTVANMGELPDSLPVFLIPDIPFNLDTLLIILPYSLPMAIVGLLESLLTAQVIDEATETSSNKNRETTGQGIANVVTGFFGGMAGCAMIGQSGINVRSGGRGRLSTFVAGAFLLVLVVGLGDVVGRIPMPALVAVMIMVSFETFSWRSIRELGRQPLTSSVVMLVTVAVVLATHNLALGVLAGVLLSGVFFAWKVGSMFHVTSGMSEDGTRRTYTVTGQVFFATANDFVAAFDFADIPQEVVIDATHAHFWDTSSVAALEKVVGRLRRAGAAVRTIGLNEASASMIKRLGALDKIEPQQVASRP